MEEFKSNSFKSKEESPKRTPDKKVDKVVSGKTVKKKKNEARKFLDIFIKDDLENIGAFIVSDVLVPAIKRTILDSVKAVIGDPGGSTKATTTAAKISYRGYYENEGRRDYSSIPARTGFDYDEIIFGNRGDAEAVLNAMDATIAKYGLVSVGDLYDLSDISTDNYTVTNYGWTDLHGSKVVPTRDGYMLKLPRALSLK